MDNWISKIGPWIDEIKNKNIAEKEQEMSDAYQSLSNSVDLYNSSKDSNPQDYEYAGQKIAENLKRMGLPVEGWKTDDVSDQRVETISHAIKNFNKDKITAKEFYDRIKYAVMGKYVPEKVDPTRVSGLVKARYGNQEKLGSQYLAALDTDPTSMSGTIARLRMTGNVPEEVLNSPDLMQRSGLIDAYKDSKGTIYDISDDALKMKMAQELPPRLVQGDTTQKVGLLPYLNSQDIAQQKIDSKTTKQESDILNAPQVRFNDSTKRNEVWYYDKSGKPKEFIRVATSADLKEKPEKDIDDALVKKTIQEMPKLKKEAIAQSANIGSIDNALNILKTSDVSGKAGQLKAWLAPYAEAFGMDTKGMNDAQTYQLLTRVLVGPMRLDIIGPGPVSEWEQKLMQQVSGGGGAGKEAAFTLLNYYRKLAETKINNYNETLDGLIEFRPNASKLYKKIETRQSSHAVPAKSKNPFD